MNAQTKVEEPSNKKPVVEAQVDDTIVETDVETGSETVVADGDYTMEEVAKKADDEKHLEKRFSKLETQTEEFRAVVHELACQAMYYARWKHDYSKASRLMYIIGEKLGGDNIVKLRQWFQAFGPFKWTPTKNKDVPDTFKTKDGGYAFRKSNSKDANVFNVKAAEANPFWTLKRLISDEEMTELLDTDDAYKSFMRRARGLLEDLKDARGEIKSHPEQITGSETTKKAIIALEKALAAVFQDEDVTAPEASKKAA